MTPEIMESEWRAELERLSQGDDGLTPREISELSGRPQKTVEKMITSGVLAGRYVKGMALRTNKQGRAHWVPVYRIKEESK